MHSIPQATSPELLDMLERIVVEAHALHENLASIEERAQILRATSTTRLGPFYLTPEQARLVRLALIREPEWGTYSELERAKFTEMREALDLVLKLQHSPTPAPQPAPKPTRCEATGWGSYRVYWHGEPHGGQHILERDALAHLENLINECGCADCEVARRDLYPF